MGIAGIRAHGLTNTPPITCPARSCTARDSSARSLPSSPQAHAEVRSTLEVTPLLAAIFHQLTSSADPIPSPGLSSSRRT